MRTALVDLLTLLLVGLLPMWPYAEPTGFDYDPSALLGMVLLVIVLMVVMTPRGRPHHSCCVN